MSTKVYNDWDGIGEITSLPDHKNDMEFISADGPEVRTVIVCPSTIYGPGREPGSTTSHQIAELARSILEKEQGFQVGAGESSGPNVYIHDLSDCHVRLVEAAIQGGGKVTWVKKGYYLVENGGAQLGGHFQGRGESCTPARLASLG